MTRRERLLLAALAAGSLTLWMSWSEREGRTASIREADRLAPGDPPVVQLDALEQEPAGFVPPGRDLFAYYEPPAPPPPIRQEPVTPPAKGSNEPVVPPPPPVVQPPVPRPAFRYLGLLGEKGDPIAVFGKGEEVIVAQVGDVVDDAFTLRSFRYEAVELECLRAEYRCETLRMRKQGAE
jgi:hypothetical protein